MDELVDGYARWMRSWDASGRTIDARVNLARNRIDAWGLDGFTAENVQTYLGTPGWSRWTRATYHANLKSFCEYLVAAGYLDASPMDDVRRVQRPRSLPRPLSDAEMSRAVEAMRAPDMDPRIGEWITLARRAGLRCHEIAKIEAEHLTERGLFVLGKGNKEAWLPIHPEIASIALRHDATGHWYLSRVGSSDHIQRATITRAVSGFFTGLGITGSIHRVRHNFGTDLLRAGVDLRTVQELMRHSSLATTAVYTAVDTDRLTDAIGRLPAA